MAKQRSINTKIWSDTYFDTLDPIEKLLFLYLLTNIYTNICGIYELPIKVMATETGIDRDMVKKVLQRFENDQKVFFIDGYICIRNFIKNQSVNPSVSLGIERELNEKPQELIDKISNIYDVYTGCIQAGTPNLTKPNLTKPSKKPKKPTNNDKNSIYNSKQFGLTDTVSVAFLDFLENRPKKCFTDHSIKALLNLLKQYDEQTQLQMIEKSVAGNYQGIFKPTGYVKPIIDYSILENFDKGMVENVDKLKERFKNKYGNERQNEYSKKKSERRQSDLILKH